jgi:RimJ/RimL family protein N-acetyltransferase
VTGANEQRWTDRLHLRRLTEDDLAGVGELEGSEEVVRGYLADWASDSLGYWAVERNGTLIGVAGLRFLTFHLRETWNLYARFAPHAWGRGYALEVVEEALVVAQEQSQNLPVVARTNEPYGFSLAERAGLTRRKDLDRDGLEVHVTHW